MQPHPVYHSNILLPTEAAHHIENKTPRALVALHQDMCMLAAWICLFFHMIGVCSRLLRHISALSLHIGRFANQCI